MSVKETVERFTIYEADIKDEDTDKGKRVFYVLGTRLVIERGDAGQTFKRKNKVSRIVWQTKRSLRERPVKVVEPSKKPQKRKVEFDRPDSESRKIVVTVPREHPGSLRKHKTRALDTFLSASEREESSAYNSASSLSSSSEYHKKKSRKEIETDTEIQSTLEESISKELTPKQERKRIIPDVPGDKSGSSSSLSPSDDEGGDPRFRKHKSLPERPAKKDDGRENKRHTSWPSERPHMQSETSGSSDIDVGDTGIGECLDDQRLMMGRKKHESVIWSDEQKKVFYSSFARKSHDYSVYISPDEAFKRAKELNVYDPNDERKVYVSCPVFKVVAVPTQIMGKEGFIIKAIKKIYFQDRAGHVQAGMMDVIYHDKSNSEPNDFVFDATQIRDNIVPPVKISQDLKIPMIIGALTTLLQVLQVVISYYLTTGISTNSST